MFEEMLEEFTKNYAVISNSIIFYYGQITISLATAKNHNELNTYYQTVLGNCDWNLPNNSKKKAKQAIKSAIKMRKNILQEQIKTLNDSLLQKMSSKLDVKEKNKNDCEKRFVEAIKQYNNDCNDSQCEFSITRFDVKSVEDAILKYKQQICEKQDRLIYQDRNLTDQIKNNQNEQDNIQKKVDELNQKINNIRRHRCYYTSIKKELNEILSEVENNKFDNGDANMSIMNDITLKIQTLEMHVAYGSSPIELNSNDYIQSIDQLLEINEIRLAEQKEARAKINEIEQDIEKSMITKNKLKLKCEKFQNQKQSLICDCEYYEKMLKKFTKMVVESKNLWATAMDEWIELIKPYKEVRDNAEKMVIELYKHVAGIPNEVNISNLNKIFLKQVFRPFWGRLLTCGACNPNHDEVDISKFTQQYERLQREENQQKKRPGPDCK